MKANEFRIGNFVEILDEAQEVTGVIRFGLYFKNGYCQNIQEWIKPIPLTEEWLIKFGFDKNVDYFLNKKGFTICFEISGDVLDCYLESIGIDILYVHQLQNLYFALTGEELKTTT